MKNNLKTILYGIFAGAAIALGGILNIVSKTLIAGEAGKIIGSLLFPVGLTLVCFLGLNLYTGKIGYLLDNDKKYLPFLLFVYIGNIIGSLIVGFLTLLITKNIDSFYGVASTIATNKANAVTEIGPIFKTLGFACLCGMLVYIAVYLYKKLNNVILKVIGIFVPIALFVYFGFDHCVANMFYFTLGFSFANPYSYLNILIATIGNSAGAIVLNELIKLIQPKKAAN